MIEVEHLTKSYGQAHAVNDISFKVEKGEILGFLGPNGAGKTTTMRILTGYLPATGGTARVAGFDVFEDSMEVRKRIGYLPEVPPLYPDMAVGDYLAFVARIKGVADADLPKRVAEAMRMTNLTERKDWLIKKLSRGFKQRVGIAQAVVHNPDVVILDEPTVGLDPTQRNEVRNLIKGLAGEHTIILSTHILSEVETTCDRVIIINKGKIAAIDTPGNLTTQLKGGEQVKIVVRGDADGLRDALEKVEGISKIEVESIQQGQQGGGVSAMVESDLGLDLRGKIAAAVVHSGYELLELRAISLSLEEIFMQLTTDESSVEAKAA
ncbi:MAG: ABC transporter ATP-binding protein [Acidobacteriota bacterium]